MVGMHMGVEHRANPPAMTFGEAYVNARLERGIDHRGGISGAHHVRETPLTRTPYLDDSNIPPAVRHVGCIPGETPCLHPSFERERLHAHRLKFFGSNPADLAAIADGDHRAARRQRDSVESVRAALLQRGRS